MKQLSNKFMLAIALVFGLAACAVTDFDRDIDFNHYRTFAWGPSEIKVDNPEYRSGLIDKRIKAVVKEEFAKRGIYFDAKHPDFLVGYKTYTEERHESYSNAPYGPFMYGPFFMSYQFGYMYMPYGYGMMPYGYANGRSYAYTQGTLIIDITDKASNDLIWRGTVKGNVEYTSSLSKQLRKGIKAILKKYPVRPGELPTPGPKHTIS
jgi:hypothetical protein